ncbi:MAG: hypothetical protein DMF56_12555 [Acidobacteria bacterium]|nr:MAG: hypothetical protein DMF56_12555 [Acidobacteriota bacterium]
MRRTLFLFALLFTALCCFAGERDRFTYVFSRGGKGDVILSHGSVQAMMRIKNRFVGTYLYARLDGREYLIRDAASIDDARHAVAPLDAILEELEPIHQKMRPLEKREEAIDRELDALTDNENDQEMTAEKRDRIRELERQQHEVERDLRVYEREEERFDHRQDALDKVFDEEIRRIVERAVRTGVAERVD